MDLSGKVCIVTGASGTIGREIAVEISRAGGSVVINYNNHIEGAECTLRRIKDAGGYGTIIQCDVRSFTSVKIFTDKVISEFGKIDVLVNNAGISKNGLFIDMNEDVWDNIIDTNLKGVYNCTYNVLEHMVKNKCGSIINISSIWGEKGASCEVIYSAAKGGVNAFTKALARELGPSNIRVNAIAPGVIDTSMNSFLNCEEKEELRQEIPLMHFGEGKDIGKLAAFLACDDSKYITGQIITVDGGFI